MTTPLQQAIFEELEKYTSTEIMRDNAQTIANKVAERDEIASCSKTYVMRMIKRREDSSAKVQFKVEPAKKPEPESEEESEEEETFALDPHDSDDDAEDDWDFDDEPEEEEEESDSETTPKKDPKDTPIEELIDAKAAKTLVVVPFRMLSDWTGYEGFKLSAEETNQLVPVIRPLLIKYVPDILGQYFPEIMCAFVVISVLGPKVKGYREFQVDQKKVAIAQAKSDKATEEAKERENKLMELERLRLLEEKSKPSESIEIESSASKDDPKNVPKWL